MTRRTAGTMKAPVLLGVIALWAISAAAAPRTLLSCDFIPLELATDRVSGCALRTADGQVTLRRETLGGIDFGPDGVRAVIVDGQLLFANPSGKTASALPFDNGADDFAEGLARTLRDGKVGFVNRDLDEVVPPTWDFAFPFECGLAVVCRGCAASPVEPGAEHLEVAGGTWGWIDRTGAIVVPVELDRDRLPARDALPGADCDHRRRSAALPPSRVKEGGEDHGAE